MLMLIHCPVVGRRLSRVGVCQVPSFILGGESVPTQESGLSLSGSTQYSLTLSSYLQSLSDTMTPSAVNGPVTIDDMSRGLVSMPETESSTEHSLHGHLLQMVEL